MPAVELGYVSAGKCVSIFLTWLKTLLFVSLTPERLEDAGFFYHGTACNFSRGTVLWKGHMHKREQRRAENWKPVPPDLVPLPLHATQRFSLTEIALVSWDRPCPFTSTALGRCCVYFCEFEFSSFLLGRCYSAFKD